MISNIQLLLFNHFYIQKNRWKAHRFIKPKILWYSGLNKCNFKEYKTKYAVGLVIIVVKWACRVQHTRYNTAFKLNFKWHCEKHWVNLFIPLVIRVEWEFQNWGATSLVEISLWIQNHDERNRKPLAYISQKVMAIERW